MANNYSQFSEGIQKITPEEAMWINEFLKTPCPDEEEDPKGFKSWCTERKIKEGDGPDWFPNFEWALEEKDTSLWLYASESADIDYLVIFLQAFFKKFRPDAVFTATGADTCSKLRVGEFGGWWIAVSAKKVLHGNTYSAAEAAAKKLRAAIEKGKKK
jgi:hypothetical protein